MAMTPEEKREFEELKRKVDALQRVEDVAFIENGKRRITRPVIIDLGITEVISKETTGTTSGTVRSVNEAGASSYSVADVYDGTITIRDISGATYKLGYYTP
jgi:hypothetical protein